MYFRPLMSNLSDFSIRKAILHIFQISRHCLVGYALHIAYGLERIGYIQCIDRCSYTGCYGLRQFFKFRSQFYVVPLVDVT